MINAFNRLALIALAHGVAAPSTRILLRLVWQATTVETGPSAMPWPTGDCTRARSRWGLE
jgi:hypothetical protein